MAKINVKIRGRTISFDAGTTKADIARALFEDNAANYTTNEVSKAVPMAYSQAMSIAKKMGTKITYQPAVRGVVQGKPGRGKTTLVDPLATLQLREAAAKARAGAMAQSEAHRSEWDQSMRAPGKRSMKPMKSKILDDIKKGKPVDIGRVSGRVGKLRVPGRPSDTDVGECANCGYDLVIRNTGPGAHYTFIHVNVSAEEMLAVVQFCHGVPKVLIA